MKKKQEDKKYKTETNNTKEQRRIEESDENKKKKGKESEEPKMWVGNNQCSLSSHSCLTLYFLPFTTQQIKTMVAAVKKILMHDHDRRH